MKRINFSDKWTALVMQCITSVQYQVIFNGQISHSINPSRGIRQGHPLSPCIYILAANVLSCILNSFERSRNLKGIIICDNAQYHICSMLMISVFFFGCIDQSVNSIKASLVI